jgi:deoxyribonuclease-4
MSIAGGVSQGLARAAQIGITVVQIFTKNNNRWQEKPLDPAEVERFQAASRSFQRAHLISHAGYLINLASSDPEIYERSCGAARDELDRAETLGLSWVVLHPGSHVGRGEDLGLKRIAESIGLLLAQTDGYAAGILLETTAGQGSSLGYCFEHLAFIMEKVKSFRLGVCIDTCHLFAAGYDLRTLPGYQQTLRELDKKVGLAHVHAVHLNDSKKPLGSRRDRHEQIGKGELGLDAFRYLLNDPRLRHLPMVLETPKGPDMKEDVENLRTLRSLFGTVRMRTGTRT